MFEEELDEFKTETLGENWFQYELIMRMMIVECMRIAHITKFDSNWGRNGMSQTVYICLEQGVGEVLGGGGGVMGELTGLAVNI